MTSRVMGCSMCPHALFLQARSQMLLTSYTELKNNNLDNPPVRTPPHLLYDEEEDEQPD